MCSVDQLKIGLASKWPCLFGSVARLCNRSSTAAPLRPVHAHRFNIFNNALVQISCIYVYVDLPFFEKVLIAVVLDSVAGAT